MANEMYRMYDEMLKGYKENNENMIEHGVKCWMDLNPENPFEEGTPAHEKFYSIQIYYSVWKMGGADYRVNRKRMIQAAKELCELYPKRPYKFDRKGDAEDKAAKAASEAERLKLEKERQEKAIEEEAERIVKAEEAARKAAKEKEKARVEWEQNEARIKAEEEAYALALQKAVDAKRAEMLAKEEEEEKKMEEPKMTVLGVLPEDEIPAENSYEEPVESEDTEDNTEEVTEDVVEEEEKKPNFIMRLFGRRRSK